MLAANVQEVTTTTGTGNITLTGASEDGRTFASQFSINDRFSYYIDDRAGNWENGIGYLSDATTLVRYYVIGSSTGSAINFAAGTKQVFISRSDTDLRMPQAITGAGNNENIHYPESFVNYSNSYTSRSNQMYLFPYVNSKSAVFNNWALYVKTASVGAVVRMGIYSVDETTGLPTGLPLMESDDIDCSVTGLATSSFANNTRGTTSPVKLPNYFVLGLAFEDSVIKVAAISYTAQLKTWMGSNSNGAFANIYQGFTLGTPTPSVAALPAIGVITSRNENVPIGGFN